MSGEPPPPPPPEGDSDNSWNEAFGWVVIAVLLGAGYFAFSYFSADPTSQVDVDLADCSITADGDAVARGTIHNRSSELLSVFVEVGFYDADGVKIDSGNDLESVRADGTARFEVLAFPSILDWEDCLVDRVSAW